METKSHLMKWIQSHMIWNHNHFYHSYTLLLFCVINNIYSSCTESMKNVVGGWRGSGAIINSRSTSCSWPWKGLQMTPTDRKGRETMQEKRIFHRCLSNEIKLDIHNELQGGKINLITENFTVAKLMKQRWNKQRDRQQFSVVCKMTKL